MNPTSGTALPTAQVGNTYAVTFAVASGGVGPFGASPFTLTPKSTPPPGLVWANSTTLPGFDGTLSGTPTTAGSTTFEIVVTDSTGTQTTVSYPLTIEAPGGVLTFQTTALAPAGVTVNSSYTLPIFITGGNGPYSFSSTGNLPPGFSFLQPPGTSGECQVSGTPRSAGTFAFTVSVTDSSIPPQSASIGYSIQVDPLPP